MGSSPPEINQSKRTCGSGLKINSGCVSHHTYIFVIYTVGLSLQRESLTSDDSKPRPSPVYQHHRQRPIALISPTPLISTCMPLE